MEMKHVLGCINNGVANKLMEVTMLLGTCEAASGILGSVLDTNTPYKRDTDRPEII